MFPNNIKNKLNKHFLIQELESHNFMICAVKKCKLLDNLDHYKEVIQQLEQLGK